MLKVQLLNKKEVYWGSLSDIKPSNKLVWVDCIRPSNDDIKSISEKTKIPVSDFLEAVDEDERPRVYDSKEYSYIIFRLPLSEGKEITASSIAIFFYKNVIITLRQREHDSFKRIYDMSKEQKQSLFGSGPSHFIYLLLDESLADYFTILDQAEEMIDKIENKVLKKPDKNTVKQLFDLKKTLIYFHKALAANRDVISAIEKEYLTHIEKKELRRFNILYHDIAELIDIEGTYMDILTGSLDIYLSSVSNNINAVMKRMTAMGSFILIPTLISGIYGMNFRYMPEIYWTYGYPFAIGLMILSIVLCYIYFKRKGWL